MGGVFNIPLESNFIKELVAGVKARNTYLGNGLIIFPNELAKYICESYFEQNNKPEILSLGSIFSGKTKKKVAQVLDCFFTTLEILGERNISLIKLAFEARGRDTYLLKDQADTEYVRKSLAAAAEVLDFWENHLKVNSLQDLPLYRKNLARSLPEKLLHKYDFVYLAGSTCSEIYVREFATGLVKNGGCVVLSGLDKSFSDSNWQMHLNNLLKHLDIHEVELWNQKSLSSPIKKNVRVTACKNQIEEGFYCAKLLEEGLKKGEKVALITNDKFLAKRVSQHLNHYDPYLAWNFQYAETCEGNLILLSYRFLIQRSLTIDNILHFLSTSLNKCDIEESEKIAEQYIKKANTASNWIALWNVHKEFVIWLCASAEELVDEFEKVLLKHLANLNCEIDLSTWKSILNVVLKSNCQPPKSKKFRVLIGNFISTRLLHFDRVVLGGASDDYVPGDQIFFEDELLEGIGKRDSVLAHQAYDFMRLTFQNQVFITYSAKEPSRFILQFQNSPENLSEYGDFGKHTPVGWQDFPLSKVHFPKQLSVSDLDLLLQNPYAFYVKKILRIKQSDSTIYKESGKLIHHVLSEFISSTWKAMATVDQMEQALLSLFLKAFENMENGKIHLARLTPFIKKFIAWEKKHSEQVNESRVEMDLKYNFEKFTLKGRIDRVDFMKDGTICILDYKRNFPRKCRKLYQSVFSDSQELVRKIKDFGSTQLFLYALLLHKSENYNDCDQYQLRYLKYEGVSSPEERKCILKSDELMEIEKLVNGLKITRQFNVDGILGSECSYIAGICG